MVGKIALKSVDIMSRGGQKNQKIELNC